MAHLYINADDIGLSRGVTDTILRVADAGAIDGVSIIANGEALAYALSELEKRPLLKRALHANLTEGRALTSASLLTTPEGFFRYSPLRLWLRYLCAFPQTRARLRAQVQGELRAQHKAAGEVEHVDGHQHVHMIPFIFDELIALSGVRRVRLAREPLYVVPGKFCILFRRAFPVLGLSLLAFRNRRTAAQRGILTNGYCIGILYTGCINAVVLKAGLASLPVDAGEIEVVIHPGSATEGELQAWYAAGAEISWHYASLRTQEREFLMSGQPRLIASEYQANGFGKILRFVVSGVSAAAVDLGLLWLFTSVFGFWYVYSTILAFLGAFGVSFLLQKSWTFKDTGAITPQLALFLGVQLVSLILNTTGVYLLVERAGLGYVVAQVYMIVVISIGNFFVFEIFIFSSSPSFLLQRLLRSILGILPEGTPQWIYTTLLRPRPLRTFVHKLLRRVIPPTLRIEEGTLVLNQDDPVVSAALALGVYESGSIRKWRELLQVDSQVLDIGANIGLFTLIAAQRAPHGSVMAFEPQKENAQFLSRTVAQNELTNVAIITAGASDSDGQASLYLHPDNKGMHSLLPVGDIEERITLVRADDIVAQRHLSPTLIKLDVEGWEAKALRGLEETLRRCHPTILFEFAPARIRAAGDDPDALLAHVRDLGYTLTVLEDNDGYQNILAI